MSSEERIIQKGERLQLRIGRSDYAGKEYFGIRQYALPKGGKDFVPTKAGVNVPLTLESLVELKEAFNESIDEQMDILSATAPTKRKAKQSKPTGGKRITFIAKARIDGKIVKSANFTSAELLFAEPISKMFNVTRAEARELSVGYFRVTTSPEGGSVSDRLKANKTTGYTPKY